MEIDYEILSTAILPLLLIKEGRLSFTGNLHVCLHFKTQSSVKINNLKLVIVCKTVSWRLLNLHHKWVSHCFLISLFEITNDGDLKSSYIHLLTWIMKVIIHMYMDNPLAHLDVPPDWRQGGRGFNPCRGRQHSFVEIDNEIFSMVILSLPLIQEGQLSVSGEGMGTILVNRLED